MLVCNSENTVIGKLVMQSEKVLSNTANAQVFQTVNICGIDSVNANMRANGLWALG